MTNKRYSEIYNEGLKRMEKWLLNSDFDQMTHGGSKMIFDMSLGLMHGYPFEKKNWMNEDDFKGFVTEYEFNSYLYDEIIKNLYMVGYKTHSINTKEK
jgi:hypothetical protein